MNPTLQDIRVDTILSRLSIAYKNAEYVAEQILPVIKSKKRTGQYFIYDKSKFRRVKSLRAMGSDTKEVGYGLSKSSAYVVQEHALKELVPDELVDEAPNPLSPNEDATENVTERLLVEKEYDLAIYMQSTGNFTNNTTLTLTDRWSDYANSNPISDIRTAKQAIHGEIFQDPNVLVLGKQVFDKLVDHPDIVDRIKYSAEGVITEAILARLFGVEKVIIAAAGYETAVEGQDSSIDYIWGKNAWLLYVNPRPKIKAISYGYHFQKDLRVADKWYDKSKKGTYVRVTDQYVREIVAELCGYLIKDAVA